MTSQEKKSAKLTDTICDVSCRFHEYLLSKGTMSINKGGVVVFSIKNKRFKNTEELFYYWFNTVYYNQNREQFLKELEEKYKDL